MLKILVSKVKFASKLSFAGYCGPVQIVYITGSIFLSKYMLLIYSFVRSENWFSFNLNVSS